jgi:hypothetical protein
MRSKVAALILAAGSVASAQTITHQTVNPNAVTRVATALDHLSLIELPEPIVRAAVGSEDIQIEWHGNTVALKPLRQGRSTNLFVWTEHTQTSYEILPPGEVTNAAFVIDQTDDRKTDKAATAKTEIANTEIQKAADALIVQTMLQSSAVNSRSVKNSKDHVNVRITEIVRDKGTLYIRFTVSNPGQQPYRINDPEVYAFTPISSSDVAGTLKGLHAPEQKPTDIGGGTITSLTVRETHIGNRDVNPGQSVDGVLCFSGSEVKPQIYRFIFSNDRVYPIEVEAVL